MHLQHKAARSTSDVLPIVVWQTSRRLHMGERPRHWVVIDNRETIDGNPSPHRVVTRLRGFASRVVGAVAAHVDYVACVTDPGLRQKLCRPVNSRTDRGATPEHA